MKKAKKILGQIIFAHIPVVLCTIVGTLSGEIIEGILTGYIILFVMLIVLGMFSLSTKLMDP